MPPHFNLDSDPPSSQNTANHSSTEEQLSFQFNAEQPFQNRGHKSWSICSVDTKQHHVKTSQLLHPHPTLVWSTALLCLSRMLVTPSEPAAFHQRFGQV